MYIQPQGNVDFATVESRIRCKSSGVKRDSCIRNYTAAWSVNKPTAVEDDGDDESDGEMNTKVDPTPPLLFDPFSSHTCNYPPQSDLTHSFCEELTPYIRQPCSPAVIELAHSVATSSSRSSNIKNTQGELATLLEFHDSIFYKNEALRDMTLANALRDYAQTSKKAEDKRSIAVGIREDHFLLAEHRFQKQFDHSQASFSSKFSSREAFRNKGQYHRSHEQSKLLGRFEAVLEQLLKSFQARLSILIRVEAGCASEFRSRVSEIRDEMDRIIVQTRESLNTTFVESLRKFGYDVYIAPIPKFKSPVPGGCGFSRVVSTVGCALTGPRWVHCGGGHIPGGHFVSS